MSEKELIIQIECYLGNALFDGETLSRLMIDYNVRVNLVASYELKRIDSDYFNEE